MVGLLVNNTFAVLAKGSIPMEVNNALFELEFQKGSRSFTFKLPCVSTNQTLFNFPELLANNNKEVFDAEFDAYITFGGNILYRGKFKLRSANRQYYEGFFKSDFGDITEFVDKKIGDLLAGELFTFPTQAYSDLEDYTAVGSDVCFPTIKAGNIAYNKYPYSATAGSDWQWNDTDDIDYGWFEYLSSPLLPQFRWLYIFELVLGKMGYRIKNTDWNASEPDTNKFCIFSNTTLKSLAGQLPKTFNISNHLPDLTVGEFLKETRYLMGLWFDWDSKYKQLTIYFYKDLISTEEADDWTAYANPDHTAMEAPYKGFAFQFAKDGTDKKQSEQPKDLKNYRIGSEIISRANLPIPTVAHSNTVRMIRRENGYRLCRFMHKLNGVDIYGWELQVSDPIYENKVDEGGTKITPKFSPLNATDRITYKPNTANIVAHPSDPLLIKLEYQKVIWFAPNTIPSYIKLKNSKLYSTVNVYGVAVATPTYLYVNADFVGNEENIEFEWIFELDHFIPELDAEINYSDIGEKKANNPYRVFMYHGLKRKRDTEDLYPYASACNFLNDGLTNPKIAEFAIRYEGEDGLLRYFWQQYIDFFRNAVVYKTKAVLPINVLSKPQLWRKKRIHETNVFITKISYALGEDISECDIEFIKTGISSKVETSLCVDGQPCEPL